MKNNVLKRFSNLESILAALLICLPLILVLSSGEFRSSISDYAYSEVSQLFSGLIWFTSSMFIYNGFVRRKWYNVVLGLSLIAVALTPHLDFPFLHYSSAALFFLGSVFVMIYFSSSKQRIFKVFFGLIIFLSLLIHFLFNLYSLFFAEWIGILPISIHFIGESLNKLD